MDFEDLEQQAWDEAGREYVECLVNNREILMQAIASGFFMPEWMYSTME